MSNINVCDLQKRNGIYITSIMEGMQKYPFYILEGTLSMHQNFLLALLEQNGTKDSFADFYYRRIKDQRFFEKYVTAAQYELLGEMIQSGYENARETEYIIEELTTERLTLLTTISYQELLFSTFYFTKVPCTVWSNYRGRFLLFVRDRKESEELIALAKTIGLQIEQ